MLDNWRGIVAPSGISDADKTALTSAIQTMYESEAWKQQLTEKGWDDAYLPAEEFTAFLAEEKTRVQSVLKNLGLV